jgi:hypothetical protein
MQFMTELSCHFAAEPILHNQISIMHIHAQNMQKFVLEKSSYAKLSTEVHARSGLEQPRQGLDNDMTAAKKPWNKFPAPEYLFHRQTATFLEKT